MTEIFQYIVNVRELHRNHVIMSQPSRSIQDLYMVNDTKTWKNKCLHLAQRAFFPCFLSLTTLDPIVPKKEK